VAAGEWPKGRAIKSVRGDGERVRVSGGGRSGTLDGDSFREAVNSWGQCMRPHRYPRGSLPATIPSRWMTVWSRHGAAVVTGRGWGHGAGMVQWGAYGKARRGFSAARILSYYYGGLRPAPFPEPGLIRVEIATGLTALRILPSAPGAIIDGAVLGVDPVVVSGGDELNVRGAAEIGSAGS